MKVFIIYYLFIDWIGQSCLKRVVENIYKKEMSSNTVT